MSTRNDYQFGGFGTIQVWTNVPLDPLPLFRPFRVGDGGQGTGDRKLDRLSPEQGDFYRVLLRSTAPHLLLRHPGPEEGREHRPYRATAETVEELLTALEWDVYRLLRSRLSPFYLIHAGAVAWGGVGWILYAPSGRGKSTLVAGLLSRGFQYLSDEIVILDPCTRSIRPFPKRLSFEEEPLHLPRPQGPGTEVVTYQVAGSRWRSCQIDPEAIGPPLPPLEASFPVRFLVKVAHDPKGKSHLAPMSRAGTVMELLKSSFNFDRHRDQGVELLVRLAEECECLSLSANRLEDATNEILRMSDRRGG